MIGKVITEEVTVAMVLEAIEKLRSTSATPTMILIMVEKLMSNKTSITDINKYVRDYKMRKLADENKQPHDNEHLSVRYRNSCYQFSGMTVSN